MENGLVFHRQSSLEYTRGSELGEEREYQRELQEYQRDKSSKNEQLAADLAALEITSSSATSSYVLRPCLCIDRVQEEISRVVLIQVVKVKVLIGRVGYCNHRQMLPRQLPLFPLLKLPRIWVNKAEGGSNNFSG